GYALLPQQGLNPFRQQFLFFQDHIRCFEVNDVQGGRAVPVARPHVLRVDRILASASSLSDTVQPFASPDQFLFKTFYHPYALSFLGALDIQGADKLFQRASEGAPYYPISTNPSDNDPTTFFKSYGPQPVVAQPYPKQDVDFASGPYAQYDWELFLHAPLLVAERLSQNRR